MSRRGESSRRYAQCAAPPAAADRGYRIIQQCGQARALPPSGKMVFPLYRVKASIATCTFFRCFPSKKCNNFTNCRLQLFVKKYILVINDKKIGKAVEGRRLKATGACTVFYGSQLQSTKPCKSTGLFLYQNVRNVKHMTEVVAALIWDHNKFMICQRPAHKARGLLWEFVGGKVEPGESKEQALIRECQEELAVTLTVGGAFMDVTHEYPDLTVHLTLFNAEIADGVPKMLEHNNIRWITVDEIDGYPFCPADETILTKIKEAHKNE